MSFSTPYFRLVQRSCCITWHLLKLHPISLQLLQCHCDRILPRLRLNLFQKPPQPPIMLQPEETLLFHPAHIFLDILEVLIRKNRARKKTFICRIRSCTFSKTASTTCRICKFQAKISGVQPVQFPSICCGSTNTPCFGVSGCLQESTQCSNKDSGLNIRVEVGKYHVSSAYKHLRLYAFRN